jgi:hypothetical protein
MFDTERIESLLTTEIATALANTDYIIAMLNMKASLHADDESKMELLTEILQEIKLIGTPAANMELH